jgi:hypothetical protein
VSIIAAEEINQTIDVPFYGADLYLVNYNGEPYVPMRLIAEGMGLAWQAQLDKLKQQFGLATTQIVIIAADGKPRNMTCLALREFADWLDTIHLDKVKPEIRTRVARYQSECADVFYKYWETGGEMAKQECVKPPDFRYHVKLEVYDNHLKQAEMYRNKMETSEEVIQGVAKLFGYCIDGMALMPESGF